MRPIPLLLLVCVTIPACTTESARGEAAPGADSVAVRVEPAAEMQARPCDAAGTFFGGTAIADREAWYGRHLRAMRETPLCTDGDAAREVYRFTWLPSFHAPAVVRVERVPDGYRVEAKLGGGAGGYEAGPLARDTAFVLSAAQAEAFASRLDAAEFWTLPAEGDMLGLDGAQWVLEGLAGRRYHVVDRWSPGSDGADAHFRALAEWLLASGGLVPASLVKGY